MVESVQNNPFIPIAWQKHHPGMQGSDYFTESEAYWNNDKWLKARDNAVEVATLLTNDKATKQLANRLLEPFMWTTMLITGNKADGGWNNFFNLRCGDYSGFKSRKEASKEFLEKGNINTSTWSDMDWRKLNKGQAEIHLMDLAEKIYDAVNESFHTQILPTMWHVPFRKKINELYPEVENDSEDIVKISVSMAARASYTVVGTEKILTKEEHISLHDRLLTQDPPHSSPLEHCCLCVTEDEYNNSFKGQEKGWFRNYKGFKSYRQIIETKKYGDI